MSLYEILNSIDLSLEKNSKSYNNSTINNFVDELTSHFATEDSMEKLSKIPEDTLFTLDRYESNYAVCENRTTGEMYDIPKQMVDPNAKAGDILKLKDGIYQVDYKETKKQKDFLQDLVKKATKSKDV